MTCRYFSAEEVFMLMELDMLQPMMSSSGNSEPQGDTELLSVNMEAIVTLEESVTDTTVLFQQPGMYLTNIILCMFVYSRHKHT